MGNGYYGGYRNTSGAYDENPEDGSNIDDNALALAKDFHLTAGGYFGRKGNGKGVRVISCADPVSAAEHCYRILGRGGTTTVAHNLKGQEIRMTRLSDGTLVTYRRITSSQGSPAVEIRLSGGTHKVQQQKIHFVMEATLW